MLLYGIIAGSAVGAEAAISGCSPTKHPAEPLRGNSRKFHTPKAKMEIAKANQSSQSKMKQEKSVYLVVNGTHLYKWMRFDNFNIGFH